MKNTWRHIRDGFSRSLNKGKKYTYADSLSFLVNTLEKKKRKTTEYLEDSDVSQPVMSEIDEHGANDDEDRNSESVIENQPLQQSNSKFVRPSKKGSDRTVQISLLSTSKN